jgi:hypothetical protein
MGMWVLVEVNRMTSTTYKQRFDATIPREPNKITLILVKIGLRFGITSEIF